MKLFYTRTLTVIMLMVLCSAGDVQAQFWKNKRTRDIDEKEYTGERLPAHGIAYRASRVKWGKKKKADKFTYNASVRKDRYRIDVLIPLYLDEIAKDDQGPLKKIPTKAESGIAFYEGVKLAADTLDKLGYELDVHVHDITSPLENTETLINSGSLDETDLIIGAVNAAQVAPLAKFAQQQNVNFISAQSPADGGVKNNGFFTLLQPSLATHCQWIRRYVARQRGRGPVYVFHRSTVNADEVAYSNIVTLEGSNFKTIEASVVPRAADLAKLWDSTEVTTIIMPVIDNSHALKILKMLYEDMHGYAFEVYGMPSWKGTTLMRWADSADNIVIKLTEPYSFDATTAGGLRLMHAYERVFGGKPSDHVFRGFETMYWYAYLLKKYGTVFNEHVDDNAAAVFTRFEIEPRKNEEDDLLYNENNNLNLVRYAQGSHYIEK